MFSLDKTLCLTYLLVKYQTIWILRYQTMLCVLYDGTMVTIGKFHFSAECIFMQQRKRKTIYPHYIFMVKYHVDTQEYSI